MSVPPRVDAPHLFEIVRHHELLHATVASLRMKQVATSTKGVTIVVNSPAGSTPRRRVTRARSSTTVTFRSLCLGHRSPFQWRVEVRVSHLYPLRGSAPNARIDPVLQARPRYRARRATPGVWRGTPYPMCSQLYVSMPQYRRCDVRLRLLELVQGAVLLEWRQARTRYGTAWWSSAVRMEAARSHWQCRSRIWEGSRPAAPLNPVGLGFCGELHGASIARRGKCP